MSAPTLAEVYAWAQAVGVPPCVAVVYVSVLGHLPADMHEFWYQLHQWQIRDSMTGEWKQDVLKILIEIEQMNDRLRKNAGEFMPVQVFLTESLPVLFNPAAPNFIIAFGPALRERVRRELTEKGFGFLVDRKLLTDSPIIRQIWMN